MSETANVLARGPENGENR